VTLTLDRVIQHTVVHHSSTSTYKSNFIEIEETFCGQTDGHLRPTILGRLRRADLERYLANSRSYTTMTTGCSSLTVFFLVPDVRQRELERKVQRKDKIYAEMIQTLTWHLPDS